MIGFFGLEDANGRKLIINPARIILVEPSGERECTLYYDDSGGIPRPLTIPCAIEDFMTSLVQASQRMNGDAMRRGMMDQFEEFVRRNHGRRRRGGNQAVIVFYTPDGTPLPPNPDVSVAGYLPWFFDENDPLTAVEQINKNYAHGGGWRPYSGFQYTPRALYHPDDPPMPLVALGRLRTEQLRLYKMSWLAIVQPDGSHEIARVD